MNINLDMSDIAEMAEQCKKDYEPIKAQVEQFMNKYPFVEVEFSIDENKLKGSLKAEFVDENKSQISVKYVK
ncbi:hypothetical protein [Bacillus sp. mrc49]|uniref:hypothetical protein n=1 Tax=Bacillus sp. mrc49 TaxID=2054913 RepID=UPI000C27577E|nr:hypothetical protein [Bacillus sp. mrc49]PJN90978.1 hypothetical protein CVN76_07245 [Bacillus sp. mrc49]